MKMYYTTPVWYRETPLLIAVFSRSTDREAAMGVREVGWWGVGWWGGRASGGGKRDPCLRLLRGLRPQLSRDSASMKVDRASPRRETPLAFARADAWPVAHREPGVKWNGARARASRSRRSPLSRRAPARPRVTMSRGYATFWSVVTTTNDRDLMLCCLCDECRGGRLMEASG